MPSPPATYMTPRMYDTAENSNNDLAYDSSSFSSMIDTTMSIDDNSSHLILPVPSQILSQAQSFPDSQSVEERSRPPSVSELYTQASFSISDNIETIEMSTLPQSPAPSSPIPLPSPVLSPAPPPPPDYDDLSTNEIKAKLRAYGFKPASRSVMINYLEQIRLSPRLADSQSSTGTSSRTTAQDTNLADKSIKVMEYIRSNDELWKKILEYEVKQSASVTNHYSNVY